jgi:hypothetical protein
VGGTSVCGGVRGRGSERDRSGRGVGVKGTGRIREGDERDRSYKRGSERDRSYKRKRGRRENTGGFRDLPLASGTQTAV